jgi:uncharacterized membrane protein
MAAVLRRAFVAGSAAWALLLVLVPFLVSRAHASVLGTAVAVSVYGVGSLVCHQLPERSYQLWSAQMPVCARCAGIYYGAAIAALLRSRSLEALALSRPRAILAIVAIPTAATLVFEWTTGVTPANWIRAAAGAAIGIVVAWLVMAAASNQVN